MTFGGRIGMANLAWTKSGRLVAICLVAFVRSDADSESRPQR